MAKKRTTVIVTKLPAKANLPSNLAALSANLAARASLGNARAKAAPKIVAAVTQAAARGFPQQQQGKRPTLRPGLALRRKSFLQGGL